MCGVLLVVAKLVDLGQQIIFGENQK